MPEALYTPWRASYLSQGGFDPGEGCLFCSLHRRADEEALIVHRGARVYVVLNRFPYASGHVMIAPYEHRADLASMTPDERKDVIDLAAVSEEILRAAYRPNGLNVGINLGRSAGAGVVDHVHLHVVPRWDGDTNFLPVLAGTRTLPEELGTTWKKLAGLFAERGAS